MIVRLCLIAAFTVATGAAALELPSGAQLTAERTSVADRYLAPIASFDGEAIPTLTVEGHVRRQAWHLPGASLTPLQVMAPLREALLSDGFQTRLDCTAQQCGGFDFRFGTEILPAPAMFVGLRNFLFLTATKGPQDTPEALTTVLVSATQDSVYIQIIEVGDVAGFSNVTTGAAVTTHTEIPVDQGDLIQRGFLVLTGVDFDSGKTELETGTLPALEQLAQVLLDNPKLRIALVGHTDSVGSLEGNINISRLRARSVRARLIVRYGIDGNRIEAEGMGYLAPKASNLTPQGRETNRRVEAIVLSNQ